MSSFNKTVKSFFILSLILGIIFSNLSTGVFEIALEAWQGGNVVDVLWLAMESGSVIDTFKPRQASAAPVAQYSGGLLVYADGTVGTPKYKVFDDSSGFGSEQSASSVGSNAIKWLRVAASPTRDEWIIATKDSGDVIKAQVCTGVDGGISCGSATQVTASGGTHGLRNFDVAYEYSSGDALLVYGTNTSDELRKIEWNGISWQNDAQITTTRTSGTVEWVELTSRGGSSDQIGIVYADSNDDGSAYRWNGSSAANEATQAIGTTLSTADVRKVDVSFEGLSGDMVVYGSEDGGGTAREGYLSGTTWTFTNRTGLDMTTDFIDLQEPGATNAVAAFAHGDESDGSNPSEGWVYEGDGTITDGGNGDDELQSWIGGYYQLGAVSEFSSGTYRAVAVISNEAATDDIDWWTTASNFAITNRTVNARSRGASKFIDLFDYPNADKVILITVDGNSDLWADTWDGVAVDGTAWTDLTSSGTLEGSLASVMTDVVDFAFRLAPVAPTFTQVAYRWFANTDTTDVGGPLAIQDNSATLSSTGQAFRLRLLLHVGDSQLSVSGQQFKLQFAQKSGTCDTGFSGEIYNDVTTGTVMAYKNNSPNDGDNLTGNGNDPAHGGDTIVNQDYEEANNFTDTVAAIPAGQDGKWDFALYDNGATASTAYCFRVRKSDDTDINTYSVIPEITTASASSVSCSASTSTTAFGSILPISLYTSTPNVTITSSCTYGSGCTLSLSDAGSGSNPGLWKSSATIYLIASADALLVAGTDGYGIQAATTANGSGAAFSVNSKYLKTGNDVGGLLLTSTQLASTTTTYADRELVIAHKAAVGYSAVAGSYSDTTTYSCIGN